MKTYESINFDVEKVLKKPEYPLNKSHICSVFGDLFKKRKFIISEKTGNKIYINQNEPLEILHYTLDTNEDSFFNRSKC